MLTDTLSNLRFKIRLRYHYSWWVAFILIMGIVVTRFPEYYPFTERLILGLCASLAFFLAITLRQLAINVISRIRKIPLRGVVLYPFGAAYIIAREDSQPILELLLAVVGLLASLLIVFIFYAIYVALVIYGSDMFAWLVQWLAYLSLMLFIFHIVPGFPLDGGRILKSILWKATGNYNRANLISVRMGQITGTALFLGGVVLLINRQIFVGLLFLFLGWALFIAARSDFSTISLSRSLEGIGVQQIMTREFCQVPRNITVSQLARDYILTSGRRHFVVFDEGKLHGFLTTEEMKSIPRKKWESTSVSQIMMPYSQQTTAYVGQSASDLLDRMNAYGLSHVPVLDQDRVVGILTLDMLVRFNRTRMELKI